MNRIWTILMLAGIGSLLFVHPETAVSAMTKGSLDAVNLAIRLTALYALWLGFLSILEKTGIAGALAKLLRPIVRFLFPNGKEETNKFITINMSANILGLGNAATPMAIRAVKSMDDGGSKASINMVMLVVLSATSLQLLPSTVIGLRAAHGAQNPTDFLPAGILATIVSTTLGIVLVKLYGLFLGRKKAKSKKTARLPLQKFKI